MNKKSLKNVSRYLFFTFLIFLTFFAYLFIKPFFNALIFSIIIGYLLYPLYLRLNKYIKRDYISSMIITVIVLILILIPLIFSINIISKEIGQYIGYTQLGSDKHVLEFSQRLGSFGIYVPLLIEKGTNYLVQGVTNFIFQLPSILLNLIIMIFALYFILKDGKKFLEYIQKNLPLERNYKKQVFDKFKVTLNAVIHGTLVIGIIEGIVATIGFYIFGVNLPILWGFLVAIVAMLPIIGPAFVWIPVSIYHFIFVNEAQAIGMFIYFLILVSTLLDFIIKPKLISRKGKIHPLIIVIGVLGGIATLGISGLFLGPFLLTLFFITLEILFGGEYEIKS